MQHSSIARILYVDDDRDSRELLKYMLFFADPNYQVKTASNGKEALSLIKSDSFDLYILDYFLREISGIDLCREIRAIDLHKPILFYSGMSAERDKNVARQAGATEYLVKPDDLDKLTITVEKLLAQENALLVKEKHSRI